LKTKSTSQTPRTLTRKAILFITTSLALSTSVAFGTSTTWTDHTDSWFIDANWDHGQPSSTTDAFINNGGTAQIFTDIKALALSLTLGQNAGDSGTVSVSPPHAGLDVGGTIFVGYRGSGTLLINNPGGVTSAAASIASLTTGPLVSNGVVRVDGTSSTWTISGGLYVGGTNTSAGGTGLLTVTNGARVTAAGGSPGRNVLHVYPSGTLTGNATVSTTDGTTVEGTISRTVGTLTITGDLSLTSTAAAQFSVTPQDLNTVEVSVSGTATLGGRVSVTMTGTFTPGTQFTLLHAGVRIGTFGSQSINFPTGQGFTPVIRYDANNVYLYLTPNTGP
jgi:T5SS/PEP-CTERM-associated repeat protein